MSRKITVIYFGKQARELKTTKLWHSICVHLHNSLAPNYISIGGLRLSVASAVTIFDRKAGFMKQDLSYFDTKAFP